MIFAIGVLCFSLILIILLLVSLIRGGDERKKFIRNKTISDTFITTVVLLIIQVGQMIYIDFFKGGHYPGLNPLGALAGISFMFLFFLLFNKRRFGD